MHGTTANQDELVGKSLSGSLETGFKDFIFGFPVCFETGRFHNYNDWSLSAACDPTPAHLPAPKL